MTELILTYVPESEHLAYAEAQALALKRDRLAADALRLSVPDSEKLSGPVLVTRMPESEEVSSPAYLRGGKHWTQRTSWRRPDGTRAIE